MPELGLFTLKSVFVHYCTQHTLILGCASSNFKFRAIAKIAGTFGRDLGAKLP